MKEISSIVDDALSRARACILEPQATQAGVLFGVDLLRDEIDRKRQAVIQVELIAALSKTVPGSHARAFMNAVLSALTEVWEDLP